MDGRPTSLFMDARPTRLDMDARPTSRCMDALPTSCCMSRAAYIAHGDARGLHAHGAHRGLHYHRAFLGLSATMDARPTIFHGREAYQSFMDERPTKVSWTRGLPIIANPCTLEEVARVADIPQTKNDLAEIDDLVREIFQPDDVMNINQLLIDVLL